MPQKTRQENYIQFIRRLAVGVLGRIFRNLHSAFILRIVFLSNGLFYPRWMGHAGAHGLFDEKTEPSTITTCMDEEIYIDALLAQNSDSVVGLAFRLAEIVETLKGDGHDSVAQNPAVRALVFRLAWLTGMTEPDALTKAILPKANRNLGDRKAAVIYRRGVRVREFESSDTESLFDYNLNDLTIDEARKASDWDVRHHCGRALAGADRQTLAILFAHLLNSEQPAWEWSFDVYSLQQWDGAEQEERKRLNWQEAFAQVAGETAVTMVIRSLMVDPSGLPSLTSPSRSASVQITLLGSLLRRMRFSALRNSTYWASWDSVALARRLSSGWKNLAMTI